MLLQCYDSCNLEDNSHAKMANNYTFNGKKIKRMQGIKETKIVNGIVNQYSTTNHVEIKKTVNSKTNVSIYIEMIIK